MTEEEFKAWERRLILIWEPIGEPWSALTEPGGRLEFAGNWVEDHSVGFSFNNIMGPGVMALSFHAEGMQVAHAPDGSTQRIRNTDNVFLPMPDKWILRYRRSVWLSGFPIEATNHEKLEWSQWIESKGVSREELKLWGLHGLSV